MKITRKQLRSIIKEAVTHDDVVIRRIRSYAESGDIDAALADPMVNTPDLSFVISGIIADEIAKHGEISDEFDEFLDELSFEAAREDREETTARMMRDYPDSGDSTYGPTF